MKRIKGKVTLFVAALLLCFVSAPTVHAEEAKNAHAKSIINEIQLNDDVLKSIKQYGAGESTAPLYTGYPVTGLKQTSSNLTSVTVNWDAAAGAVRYEVAALDTNYQTLDYKIVTGTSATLDLKGQPAAAVIVIPYDANNGEGAEKDCALLAVYTTPKQVTGLKLNGAFGHYQYQYRLNVVWNDSVCEGFEAICYNRKGKQVQVVDTTDYHSAYFSKTNIQNIYSVKVKPYVTINGGTEKLYGQVSKTFYAVPQPYITTRNSDIKQNSINLKWKKVTGATKYVVYVSNKEKSGYKKAATLKSSKKSYKITTYKGKKLNLLNKYHYVKVVTYAKFGKKTVKSQSQCQLSARVRRIYY